MKNCIFSFLSLVFLNGYGADAPAEVEIPSDLVESVQRILFFGEEALIYPYIGDVKSLYVLTGVSRACKAKTAPYRRARMVEIHNEFANGLANGCNANTVVYPSESKIKIGEIDVKEFIFNGDGALAAATQLPKFYRVTNFDSIYYTCVLVQEFALNITVQSKQVLKHGALYDRTIGLLYVGLKGPHIKQHCYSDLVIYEWNKVYKIDVAWKGVIDVMGYNPEQLCRIEKYQSELPQKHISDAYASVVIMSQGTMICSKPYDPHAKPEVTVRWREEEYRISPNNM
jgi:hypothetical protein